MVDKEGAKKLFGYSILLLGCGYFLILVGPTRVLFSTLFYFTGIVSMIVGVVFFFLAIVSLFVKPQEKIYIGEPDFSVETDYRITDSFGEVSSVSIVNPVLLVMDRAQKGEGERNVQKTFEKEVLPYVGSLIRAKGVLVFWVNVGGLFGESSLVKYLKEKNCVFMGVCS
jgi:hypothetical protein